MDLVGVAQLVEADRVEQHALGELVRLAAHEHCARRAAAVREGVGGRGAEVWAGCGGVGGARAPGFPCSLAAMATREEPAREKSVPLACIDAAPSSTLLTSGIRYETACRCAYVQRTPAPSSESSIARPSLCGAPSTTTTRKGTPLRCAATSACSTTCAREKASTTSPGAILLTAFSTIACHNEKGAQTPIRGWGWVLRRTPAA